MGRPIKVSNDDPTIIKLIMREKDISIDVMAERMGKAKSTISNLLGRGNMTINTLIDMAKALEVEVSDLFPVKAGYVHYLEAKNIAQGIKQNQSQITMTEKDILLFKKFKAFMEMEHEKEDKDETVLINNPFFIQ